MKVSTLNVYEKLKNYPFGKKIFSQLVCFKLPYFFSIKPLVLELKPGKAVVQIKDRWSVHNHLKTVHAIALCNLCEFAMAVNTEATIPDHLRYIPAGMTVEYKKKARGTLKAVCETKVEDFQVGEMTSHIDVFDSSGDNVMSADIVLNIKEKSQA